MQVEWSHWSCVVWGRVLFFWLQNEGGIKRLLWGTSFVVVVVAA
jgi:hypothetical protein